MKPSDAEASSLCYENPSTDNFVNLRRASSIEHTGRLTKPIDPGTIEVEESNLHRRLDHARIESGDAHHEMVPKIVQDRCSHLSDHRRDALLAARDNKRLAWWNNRNKGHIHVGYSPFTSVPAGEVPQRASERHGNDDKPKLVVRARIRMLVHAGTGIGSVASRGRLVVGQ
jgi:hypothetical protein